MYIYILLACFSKCCHLCCVSVLLKVFPIMTLPHVKAHWHTLLHCTLSTMPMPVFSCLQMEQGSWSSVTYFFSPLSFFTCISNSPKGADVLLEPISSAQTVNKGSIRLLFLIIECNRGVFVDKTTGRVVWFTCRLIFPPPYRELPGRLLRSCGMSHVILDLSVNTQWCNTCVLTCCFPLSCS